MLRVLVAFSLSTYLGFSHSKQLWYEHFEQLIPLVSYLQEPKCISAMGTFAIYASLHLPAGSSDTSHVRINSCVQRLIIKSSVKLKSLQLKE